MTWVGRKIQVWKTKNNEKKTAKRTQDETKAVELIEGALKVELRNIGELSQICSQMKAAIAKGDFNAIVGLYQAFESTLNTLNGREKMVNALNKRILRRSIFKDLRARRKGRK